ncbi:hypothetical protein AB0B50_38825 [Streptomyces sp. NPDC041068]|uniref:hypothetical protein n=1 Tax=Streptomyces sp. NPDC041068 TaxID=3155130 RepID=UPI0033C3132F
MSTLWCVRVTGRSERPPALTLQVRAVHPDAGALPTSLSFAYRLLVEAADGMAASQDQDTVPADGRAEAVIEAVVVSDERNFPYDDEAAKRYIDEELRGSGLTPDGTPDAWQAGFTERWQELWRGEGPVARAFAPTASLTLHLKDTSLLPRITQGAEWRTAAYG